MLPKIVADSGYRGELVENAKKTFGWILEIVLRKDDPTKCQVLPQRWIVERTFAWFSPFFNCTVTEPINVYHDK
jgi:transposase